MAAQREFRARLGRAGLAGEGFVRIEALPEAPRDLIEVVDALKGASDFVRELFAETGTLRVVVIDRRDEFPLSAGENPELHRLLTLANMASAESSDRSPAS
jgi:phosphomannomutase